MPNHKLTTEEDLIILSIIAKLRGRESEIFHLIVNGMSLVQASKDLGITTRTAYTTLSRVRSKFNVSTTIQLLALVLSAMIRKESEEFLDEQEPGVAMALTITRPLWIHSIHAGACLKALSER